MPADELKDPAIERVLPNAEERLHARGELTRQEQGDAVPQPPRSNEALGREPLHVKPERGQGRKQETGGGPEVDPRIRGSREDDLEPPGTQEPRGACDTDGLLKLDGLESEGPF